MRLSEQGMDKNRLRSVGLASRVSLGAEISSNGSRLGEVAREDGLEEGAEDDLGATDEVLADIIGCLSLVHLRSLGKGHPQNQDELESVVEREPVHRADCALKDCQESKNDPVGQPLAEY